MRSVLTLLALLLLTAVSATAGDEPTFRGRSASDWAGLVKGGGKDWTVATDSLTEGAEEALPVLLTLLTHESGSVRQGGAIVLGRIGAPASPAIPALILCVQDDEPRVRTAAATALWKMGPEAEAALFGAIRGAEDAARKRLLEAAARGRERAVPSLVKFLGEADAAIAQAGADGLVLVGWAALPAVTGHPKIRDRILTESFARYLRLPEGRKLRAGTPPAVKPEEISLVWESGSGHGGSLALTRLTWTEDGLRFDRLRFERLRQPVAGPDGKSRKYRLVAHGGLLPKTLSRALAEVLLRVTTLDLVEEPSGRLSMWGGSGDFHAALTVRAGDETVFAEAYTGYPGRGRVQRYFRVSIAGSILREALRDVTLDDRPVDEADRALLLRRVEKFEKEYWWIQERLLRMIGLAGDERFVSFLEKFIASEPKQVRRRHVYAIDAYAAITGVDFRPAKFAESELSDVRKRYLEHFEK